MAEEESRRRRRGRRRGRRGGHPAAGPPEERPEEEQPEEEETPSRARFRFGFLRGRGERGREEGDKEEEEGAVGEEKVEERRREDREGRPVAAAPRSVSPLSFWRRGRARTFREQPMPKQTVRRTLRQIRGLQFPPWVPVLFIIALVGGILALFFVVGGARGSPRIGDHWHSNYQIFVCGQRQPNVPTFDGPGNNGTHGDGVIHNHPSLPQGEGRGAALDRWFEGGGGKLTESEMRIPGTRETFKNGDQCPDGTEGVLQVFVNGVQEIDFPRYIPKDGEQIRIVFGPEEVEPVQQEDRTIIAEDQATRTVELAVTGGEGDAAFAPNSIELKRGETVRVVITNTGAISHSLRVAGADGEYNTGDDFVSDPEIIRPDEEGTVVVRFDEEGEFEFQDPSSPNATGTFVVAGELEETPEAGTPVADTPEAVDVTLDVEVGDNFFQPAELEVEAGQKFRIKLTNNGEFVHNLRIDGLDGAFETADDLTSTPARPKAGEDGELVGQIDKPGVYSFRDDFHPTEAVGTITVK